MKRAILILGAMALLLGGVGQAKASPIYNNANDFSLASNPNGVWSYGSLAGGSSPNASTFALYPSNGTASGIDFWGPTSALSPPVDFHNPNATVLTFSTITMQPGQAAFHPGPNGEYSVYRFTTPTAGSYSLSALFTGIDVGGTTTDVHVLVNNSPLFNGSINGYNDLNTYSTTLALGVGDQVVFVVGFGSNGNYFNDSTALDATLKLNATAVPEPATLTMLGFGIAGLAGYGWRRRKQPVANA